MSRCAAALLGLLLAAAARAATAPEPSPQDFAYGMPITTPARAAAYRVAIPLEVYRQVVNPDLSDVRVFNARGEVVPYQLQALPPAPAARQPATALPLFALRGNAHATLEGLRVLIQAQNTAVNVQADAPPAADQHSINSYVVDGRALAAPLSALQLQWPNDAADFSGALTVEASDDLGTWRAVQTDAPVLNLHTEGAQLVQSRIELPAVRAKFWRLSWVGRSAPFQLLAVTADTTPEPRAAARDSLIMSGTADLARHEISFDLGARLPVDELNVELPEPNSVATIEVLSRQRASDPWRAIASGRFYRVQASDRERHNAPIAIALNTDRFWLLRAGQPPGAVGASARLRVAWSARDVVFFARGDGPFQLAYGSGSVRAAATELGSTLREVSVQRAQLGAPRTLGGATRLSQPRPSVGWQRVLLWLVLGAGIVLLGWMAYRLARDLGTRSGGP
jgi:hypothetical protein